MIVGPRWSFYAYPYAHGEEQRRAEVRFDVGLATGATPTSPQRCVRLVVQRAAPDDEALGAFERALPELLTEVDCILAGVLRYGGTAEFVLQVEDPAGLERRASALAARAPGPIELLHSDGWDFFVDRICPREHDWQRITDRETAAALVAGGLDPDSLHPLEHAFVGDAEALREVEQALLSVGFDPPRVERRRLTVIRRTSLRPDAVSEVTVSLATMGRRLGAVYDGWRLLR